MPSKLKNLPEHIHVIGICGVATSALAIAFHRAGVKVTGSDKGFFPPVSTELEKAGITFYAGWHPEKIAADGVPDAVVIGTASGSHNPETAAAEQLGIPSYSFAQAIGTFFVSTRSIVVVGTWGKTSSAALLSHIMDAAGFDPSYMFGGISLSHEAAARLSKSDWSVFEGDEYKSSPTDPTAKFFYYKPTHLLITAVSWDHADLYPTEAEYFEAFRKLIATIPDRGLIVANRDHAGIKKALAASTVKNIVWYGKKDADYTYSDVTQSKDGLRFKVMHKETVFDIRSPMLGGFQAENIAGCFAMANEIGIPLQKSIDAIASFKGLKRRLEKRLDGDITGSGVTVFDDIAHSPEKAASALKELRAIYGGDHGGRIIAVFEPNSGARERGAIAKYGGAFKDADTVIIPRLTKLKVNTEKGEGRTEKDEMPMEGDELAAIISKTHKNCRYIEDDAKLVENLASQAKKGDAIAFLGSHGFRGMIEQTVKKLMPA